MKILITAATFDELAPSLRYFLQRNPEKQRLYDVKSLNLNLTFFVTGVGLVNTVYHLTKLLARRNFDLAINVGLCGSFDQNIKVTQTVCISEEQLADFGVNDNGTFKSLFDLNLESPDNPPFKNGCLINPQKLDEIEKFVDHTDVKSITVCTASGEISQIYSRIDLFSAQVENMEGAGFFYVMLQENIPFVQIRSVSNFVEPRNKENWEILTAIKTLNESLIDLLMDISARGFIF